MLFLSVGSNYTFRQAIRHCFTVGHAKNSADLQNLLVERYQGKKALLFSRGRDALATAVRAATGGQGSVIVTSLTCYSVVDAAKTAGCKVVYADISPKTLQFDEKNLQTALKNHDVKAIIVQNTLGIATDIDKVLALAKKHNLVVIEDIAHAAGGQYADGREIGTVGDMTMLSFGRDKMIDTINGGALVIRTDSPPAVLEPAVVFPGIIRQIRDRIYPLIGWTARALFPIGLGKYVIGVSYKLHLAKRSADGAANPEMRLPHWQAKLAYKQVKYLTLTTKNRLQRQERYLETLEYLSPQRSSNAVRLPLLVENRDEVMLALKKSGYFTEDSWYEVPISPRRLYHLVDFDEKAHPVVSKVSQHVLNLPTHQLVRDEDIDKIAEIVKKEAKPWNM